MAPEHKYARIERERRFLLDQFPGKANAVRIRRITDRYIDGTTLRLRKQSDDIGPAIFKLTQKVPVQSSGAQQGFITTMYLTEKEFLVLAQLPARVVIHKIFHSQFRAVVTSDLVFHNQNASSCGCRAAKGAVVEPQLSLYFGIFCE